MKKTLFAILSLAMIFTAVSCGSTPTPTNNTTVKHPRQALIDWQGSVTEDPIQPWVKAVMRGDVDAVAKELGITDSKVFVAMGRNENLDVAKNHIQNVGIAKEVANIFEQNISNATTSMMSSATEDGKSNLKSTEENLTEVLTSVSVRGLEKKAESWIQVEKYNPDGSIKETYYEYYVVSAMPNEIFDQLMEESLSHIDETTTEAKALKDILRQKLSRTVLGTEAVTEAAEEYAESDIELDF